MRTTILLLIVLVFLVQACAPSSAETQSPSESILADPTQVPTEVIQPILPAMTPLEWINSRPFQEALPGEAEFVASGFPEGYQPKEIGYQVANLPESGLEVGITQTTYERPVDGQVYTKDSVTVQVFFHQKPEARSEHLLLLVGSEDTWEFREVEGHLIARFYSGSGDGRVWISGPYMVALWSSQDISAGDPAVDPMVDAFAALYLKLYPPD